MKKSTALFLVFMAITLACCAIVSAVMLKITADKNVTEQAAVEEVEPEPEKTAEPETAPSPAEVVKVAKPFGEPPSKKPDDNVIPMHDPIPDVEYATEDDMPGYVDDDDRKPVEVSYECELPEEYVPLLESAVADSIQYLRDSGFTNELNWEVTSCWYSDGDYHLTVMFENPVAQVPVGILGEEHALEYSTYLAISPRGPNICLVYWSNGVPEDLSDVYDFFNMWGLHDQFESDYVSGDLLTLHSLTSNEVVNVNLDTFEYTITEE